MKKILLIYGLILPAMIITSLLSKTILIGWFITASVIAIFHDQIFTKETTRITT